VRCELPDRLEVSSLEVDLVETWLGNIVAELSGGDGTTPDNAKALKRDQDEPGSFL
jgi:hypothetical protein